MKKKYIGMLLALLLPMVFVACSDDDAPQREPEVITPTDKEETTDGPQYYTQAEPYINQFCYDQMSTYYLWIKEIETSMESWYLNDNPVAKIKAIRYKENGEDVDRWTSAYEDIKSLIGSTEGVSTTTYGYDFQLYYLDESKTVFVAVVTFVYPGSPAEKAGLKRSSIILKVNDQSITSDNYRELLASSSMKVMVADSRETLDTPKEMSLTGVQMYEDPVLFEKVFNCSGKKVGYVLYNSFTFASCDRLIEVCKYFKQEGVRELVLDLRYNGGGYGSTEYVFASMLAPENNVKSGDLYMVEVYNEEYSQSLKEYKKNENFNKTYFTQKHEWVSDEKKYSYDTSEANIGLDKIYALVSSNTASASEALLVGLMPYMNIEVIGTKTSGKYCGGYLLSADEYYQNWETDLAKVKEKSVTDYNKLVDNFWKYYSGWKNYVGNWGLYVMVSSYADCKGNNPCRPDGLKPIEELLDDPREPYPLGDDREVLLREALTRAGYTDFTPLPENNESRSAMTPSLGEFIPCKTEGKRILLRPEMPRNVFSRSLNLQ